MKRRPFYIAAAFLVALISGPASAQEITVPPRVPESPELLEEGKQVYFQRCAFCHGLNGAGDGPVADGLDPRPRDFRDGLFKFRSTKSGELPKDEDLFRTIARGLPGTAMPAWQVPKKTLSDEEVWQVLHYVKTLIDPAKGLDPKDEDNNPYLEEFQLDLSDPPQPTGEEPIHKGFKQYVINACWKCHGMAGRGDGPESGTHKDDWEFPIQVADLQKPWRIKNGATAKDLRRTFLGGINGTVMPSYDVDEIYYKGASWDLAYFVEALSGAHDFVITVPAGTVLEQKAKPGSGEKATVSEKSRVEITNADATLERAAVRTPAGEEGWVDVAKLEYKFIQKTRRQIESAEPIIISVLREGDLPDDPDDPAWAEADPLDIPLSGQVIARPRLQTPTVDQMTVRSFYNSDKIVFLLEWDDRFKDTAHTSENDYPDPSSFATTYTKLWGEGGTRGMEPVEWRDSAAIQFAVKKTVGPVKPHFFLGSRKLPVNLWKWDSEKGETGAVTELNATGFKKPPVPQPAESQAVAGIGRYRDGRWSVVMSRSLRTENVAQDVQIEPGVLLPISFYAWDGRNREKGLLCSLSSWNYVLLQVPTPPRVYLVALGALLAAGFIEFFLVRSRRRTSV
ncbi:MAG: c-type cytochrome [Planctomycetota bacterium]|nr:c-type cytochrome [Planctomycetota bacterium]